LLASAPPGGQADWSQTVLISPTDVCLDLELRLDGQCENAFVFQLSFDDYELIVRTIGGLGSLYIEEADWLDAGADGPAVVPHFVKSPARAGTWMHATLYGALAEAGASLQVDDAAAVGVSLRRGVASTTVRVLLGVVQNGGGDGGCALHFDDVSFATNPQ
jgi:hypothetical protein